MVNIRKLNKLSKEELIDEIRNRDFRIKNLMKEVKIQSYKWRKFYQGRDYRQSTKTIKQVYKLTIITILMEDTKVRKYGSINVNPETKVRVDTLYYEVKVKNGLKTFDQFMNYLLDVLEEKNG